MLSFLIKCTGSNCHVYSVVTTLEFYGARAFAAAAELWNSVPDTIKQAQTVNLFKAKLKTHLFLQ